MTYCRDQIQEERLIRLGRGDGAKEGHPKHLHWELLRQGFYMNSAKGFQEPRTKSLPNDPSNRRFSKVSVDVKQARLEQNDPQ